MLRVYVLVGLSCLSYSLVFAQVKLVHSGQVIKKGIELYDSGKYQFAINEFLKVHPSDTNYIYMQSELALACLANKSYDSAIQLCETVSKKTSQYRAQVLRIWAIALDRAGKLDESIAKFNEAIEYYPFSYSMHFNLGVTYFNAKRYNEAEKSFMRALEINPFHPGANLNLAKLSALKGRRTQAMLSLGVYLALQENDNESLIYLENLSKNEIENVGSVTDDSENPFVKLDRLLKAKVALEKGFKNKVDVDAALVKQMELLIDQLPTKDESNFWCRLYYPFYEELKTKALVEPFIYHILSSSSIQSVPKWKSKNKKLIQDFYNTANATLSMFRKKIITPQKFGYKGGISAWYADNNNVEALGEMGANETKIGKWLFFDDKTQELTAEGEFDDKGAKTGIWKYYYPSGVKKSTSNQQTGLIELFTERGDLDSKYYLKEEEVNGEVEIYYACGSLKEKISYKNGKRQGSGVTFYANGIKKSTYTYDNDLMIGEYVTYYSNGNLKTKENFKNDKLDGDFVSFYADGKVESKGKYTDGKPIGEWLYYQDNGKIEKSGTFANGTSVGDWLFYDREGDLNEVRHLNPNGEVEGENKIIEKGKVITTILYKNQMPIEQKFFDYTGKQISKAGDKSGTYYLTAYLPTGEISYEGQLTKGKRTGTWKTYYHSGALKYQAQYKDDQLDGIWTEYFRNGNKKEECHYQNGELNGLFQEFYIHGILKAEGNFVNGKKEQQWIWYYPNGTKESEEYYLFGQLHGLDRDHKEDSKVVSESEYETGKIEKLTYFDKKGNVTVGRRLTEKEEHFSTYFLNKQKKWELNYTCSELTGPFKSYYPSGKLSVEFTYLNGMREGKLRTYSATGNKESEGTYVNGTSHGNWHWYFPNGKISKDIHYAYNNRDSIWTFYNNDGTINAKIAYQNDVRHGLTEVYNPEGILVLEKKFENGDLVSYRSRTKNGTLSEWIKVTGKEEILLSHFANGKVAYEEPYKNGLIHGTLKEYYQSGQLHSEVNFENGDYHGGFIEYFPNGKVKIKGNYKYDNADGNWLEYDEKGNLIKSENYLTGTLNGSFIEFENGKKVREMEYWCGSIEN